MYVDQATLWYFEARTDLSILYLNLHFPVLSDSQPKIFHAYLAACHKGCRLSYQHNTTLTTQQQAVCIVVANKKI